MSLPRRVETFQVKGPSGTRFVGMAAGLFQVVDVDGFLEQLVTVDREHATVTQALNAGHVAGAEHLVQAARLALLANANGTGFAGSLGIELVCWAAAERQIGRAFGKMGLCKGTSDLAIVSVGPSEAQVSAAISRVFKESAARWDNSLLELKDTKIPGLRTTFSISDEELAVAPIGCIILERVALLALAK